MQTRRYLIRIVGFGVVGVVAGLVFGRLVPALAFLGIPFAVAGFFAMTARFSFTTVSEEGIRTRMYIFRPRSCPWPQVADIDVRPGRTTTVRVTRTDGTRFLLGVPMTGDVMLDPMFHAKLEQITNAWRAHVPEEERQPREPRRAPAQLWRRFGTVAAALVLWVGVPILLLGAFLVARQDWSDAHGVHAKAVVMGVDTSSAPAVYDLAAAPGFTFPASAIAFSSTEAYCALMDSHTRVGDTVELVYPRSDPSQMEDVRLVPVWWHAAVRLLVLAGVGEGGSVVVRRLVSRSRRLR